MQLSWICISTGKYANKIHEPQYLLTAVAPNCNFDPSKSRPSTSWRQHVTEIFPPPQETEAKNRLPKKNSPRERTPKSVGRCRPSHVFFSQSDFSLQWEKFHKSNKKKRSLQKMLQRVARATPDKWQQLNGMNKRPLEAIDEARKGLPANGGGDSVEKKGRTPPEEGKLHRSTSLGVSRSWKPSVTVCGDAGKETANVWNISSLLGFPT